jgi:hypothetical protein
MSNKTSSGEQYQRFQETEEEEKIKVRKQQDRLIKQIYCCIFTITFTKQKNVSNKSEKEASASRCIDIYYIPQ